MRLPSLFVACVAIVALRSTAAAAAAISISQPVDLQVVQRAADGRGRVTVAGTLTEVAEDGSTVEVRIVDGGTAGEWQRPETQFEGRSFRTALSLPAGGWYRLECRLVRDEQPVAESAVGRIGVGEVFVVAGQSSL